MTVRHPSTGEPLPPFLPISRAAELCGKSTKWVKRQCEAGALPAMPHEDFARWAIPTVALLRVLGYEVEPPSEPSSSPAGAIQ